MEPCRILRNSVRCRVCGETIASRHRHDYVTCDCPDETMVAVDGGTDYLRRVFGERADFEEMSEVEQ